MWIALLLLTPSLLLAQGQTRTPLTRDPRSLYASASKTVVTITVLDRGGEEVATGSGVVVSPDGKIVTNYHLVAGGTSFDVHFPPEAGLSDSARARPVACSSEADLAMLAVTPPRRLASAKRATSLPSIGERVLAIGSPLGLEGTLSEGVVSQIRELRGTPLIQTTAQISPGSSGGGLFLYTGDLVGITTMSLTGGQNLNFAVSVDALRQLRDCESFPEQVVPLENDRSVSKTPVATPTPSICPGLERIGRALGAFSAEQSKASEEWLSALRHRASGQPMPDTNYHHQAALATLRLLAADIATGRYEGIRESGGSLLLTSLAMLEKYEAMVSTTRAAHFNPKSVAAMRAAAEAVGEYQPAYETCMRAVISLNQETESFCPKWAEPVFEDLRRR